MEKASAIGDGDVISNSFPIIDKIFLLYLHCCKEISKIIGDSTSPLRCSIRVFVFTGRNKIIQRLRPLWICGSDVSEDPTASKRWTSPE
jgi:hypothetical protein